MFGCASFAVSLCPLLPASMLFSLHMYQRLSLCRKLLQPVCDLWALDWSTVADPEELTTGVEVGSRAVRSWLLSFKLFV